MKHANLDNTFNLKKTNATEEDKQFKTDHLESKSSKPNFRFHVASTAPDTPNTALSLVSTGQAVNKVAQFRQEKIGKETVLVL